MKDTFKILHLITGLGTGGAEVMLGRLVSAMDRDRFENEVVYMADAGPIAADLAAGGIAVSGLGMRAGTSGPAALVRLAATLRRFRPRVLQTWMYHANLMGSLLPRFRGPRLIWGLHHSNFSVRANKLRTLAVIRACAPLSYCAPTRIVCCSESVRDAHRAIGYNSRKLVVIPNGYDTGRFQPDPDSGSALRAELGVPADAPVVSLMARFHPQKNHASFIEAASIVHQHRPDAHFVLCGSGVVWENPSLAGPIAARGLDGCFHLLGPVGDPRRILAGSTVLASSSVGEGMSNVIAEAMACGTVCVVTDVGESANVVGDTGFVVPPQDHEALARMLLSAIGLSQDTRRSIGAAARRRIDSHFNLSQTVHLYQTLYEAVAKDSNRPCPDRHRTHHELPTT